MGLLSILKGIESIPAAKDGVLFTDSKTKIPASDLPPVFDYREITWSNKSSRYFLKGKNIDKAAKDILSLNHFLEEAKTLVHAYPALRFDEKEFRFAEPKTNDPHYISLHIAEKTKTGKTAKFPVCLIAFVSDDLNATIYYGQDGQIGKAEISSWNKRVFETNLAIVDGQLVINTIYVTNPVTQKKQKMYFIPPAKGGK